MHHIVVRKPTEQEIAESKCWGTWEKEVSEFPWTYSEKETCLILEGSAEVETENGEKATFKAGDLVVFPQGLKCVWRIKEPIRKKYLFGGDTIS